MRLLIYDIALFLRDEEDMRKSQHLITQEVEAYMTLYEVKTFLHPCNLWCRSMLYRRVTPTQKQYDHSYIVWSTGTMRGNQLQSTCHVHCQG